MPYSDKIPTATPMFSGSSFLLVALLVSWDVDVRQKSKMAAELPEVPITLLVLQIYNVVPKTIHEFVTMYEACKSPTIMTDATSCRKSRMAANQSEEVVYPKL